MDKIKENMTGFFEACDRLSKSNERALFGKYLDVKIPLLTKELTRVIQGPAFSDYCLDKAWQIYNKNNLNKEVNNG